jgi:hypothetical protein
MIIEVWVVNEGKGWEKGLEKNPPWLCLVVDVIQARGLPDLGQGVKDRRVRVRRQSRIRVRIDGKGEFGVGDRGVGAGPVVGEARAFVKSREPIDDVRGGMRPHADGAAVRGYGEDVRRAPDCGDRGPAGVAREAHVLDLGRRVAPMEDVEVVDGG